MGLPYRRQPLGKHIAVRNLPYTQVAEALGCNHARVNSLILGRVYPTGLEVVALERLIGLPIQTMFEPEVLKYFNPAGSIFSTGHRESETDQ